MNSQPDPPHDRRTSSYRIEDFDYELPKELIAQTPLAERSSSKLLVVHRQSARLEDRNFSHILEYFMPGDVLVLNDTKVFPARLIGRKQTGGKVEALLVAPTEQNERVWKVLLQPSMKEGQEISFAEGKGRAKVLGRSPEGYVLLEFDCSSVRGLAEDIGEMPLPPYIKRQPHHEDRDTYQTVYAREEGSIAAPTAGLHFTQNLLPPLQI